VPGPSTGEGALEANARASCTKSPSRSAYGGEDRPIVHSEQLVPGEDIMAPSVIVMALLLGNGVEQPHPSRVRWESPTVAAAIQRGMARSRTFRGLVEAIERTDGMVYVLEGKCGQGVRACLHMSLELSAGNRLLRIFVDPRRAAGCELAGSIGHELQHAFEALSNPRIRTAAALSSFFRQIGPEGPRRFETPEAERVGAIVARETCRAPRQSTDVLLRQASCRTSPSTFSAAGVEHARIRTSDLVEQREHVAPVPGVAVAQHFKRVLELVSNGGDQFAAAPAPRGD
jgi:hypothetical protein